MDAWFWPQRLVFLRPSGGPRTKNQMLEQQALTRHSKTIQVFRVEIRRSEELLESGVPRERTKPQTGLQWLGTLGVDQSNSAGLTWHLLTPSRKRRKRERGRERGGREEERERKRKERGIAGKQMGLTKSISENRYENSCPRQDSNHSQSFTEMASGVNAFGCWPWPWNTPGPIMTVSAHFGMTQRSDFGEPRCCSQPDLPQAFHALYMWLPMSQQLGFAQTLCWFYLLKRLRWWFSYHTPLLNNSFIKFY